MTIEEIKELLQIFNESGVAELELQRGENRLRLRRAGTSQEFVVAPTAAAATNEAGAHAPAAASASAAPTGLQSIPSSGPASPTAPAASIPKDQEADSGHVLQKSPIVGTYYDAPSPGSPPFVRVGDSVEIGQILCIIESMKLMNEIEAEVAGVIMAKLVENGRPVEYGEALLSIRPR
jgi:acetyl-CoA carboxylase biotin carboxyl carrier protein